MSSVHDFFALNRPLVLFAYGLTFFVMGLAIFLQSRRYSQLRLARNLQWLAAFGILHGLYEWGDIFIPIQAVYLPAVITQLLQVLQIVLLAVSFLCLMMFGAVSLEGRFPRLKSVVLIVGGAWGVGFWLSFYGSPTVEGWLLTANIWARYLLGLPGSLLAAAGLRYQTKTDIEPLGVPRIARDLRIAGGALVAYAIVGGLIVPAAAFFPANVLNRDLFDHVIGIPIALLRSVTGLVLAVAIIRALEVFEIELDAIIEGMEAERIQAAERERIGQEIHDGAIQGVYSASLILESTDPLTQDAAEVAKRLTQAESVLNSVNRDLRSYMVSLRAESPVDPLIPSLRKLVTDPRYHGLLDIELRAEEEPLLRPNQVYQLVAIVQEGLANTVRHARARHATITVTAANGATTVRLEDDGRGFVPEGAELGYGIRSMRDRAHLLGGELEIESKPGHGTRLAVTVPGGA